MNQRLLDNIDKQQSPLQTLGNADELRLEEEYLPADAYNDEEQESNNEVEVALHKRKTSAIGAESRMPPSLRPELTDNLETLL